MRWQMHLAPPPEHLTIASGVLRTIDMLWEVGEFDRATGLRARLPII